MIRKISVILCVLMMLSLIPLSADGSPYPSEYWPLQAAYNEAIAVGNDAAVVELVPQVAALYAGRYDDVASSILSSYYYEMGNSAERLGDYTTAAAAYAYAIPYCEKVAEYGIMDTSSMIMVAKTKIQLYTPTLELYRATTEPQVYYGAINEPEMGILWGINCDGGTRSQIPNESMSLIYQNFGEKDSGFIKAKLEEAEKLGLAVEYALNLPGEGAQLGEVLWGGEAFIMDVIEMLNSVDVPIFLRFGAEMNVWQTPADAESYIAVFRYVADLVHKYTDHVAVVWSPNCVSGWMMNVHDYYPGDEYVDWIGVSLYLLTYFEARDNWSVQERVALPVYYTGNAAEPVRILEDLINTYGDRKPFMLAESGASHFFRTLNGYAASVDQTEWAVDHLKLIYKYLPLAYPQIKLIAHFDSVMPNEPADYALSTNKKLTETYLELVKDGAFIQDSWKNSAAVSYEKLTDGFTAEQGITELRTMVFWYGTDDITVTYLVDGAPIASSAELPYTVSADFSALAVGAHTLTVRAEKNGQLLGEKSVAMNIIKPLEITLNGEKLAFSEKPVITDKATLVPMEELVTKLNGKISTNARTGLITIRSGRIRLQLEVGSSSMKVGSVTKTLTEAPRAIDSVVYVPLEDIAAALGATVVRDDVNRTIAITK